MQDSSPQGFDICTDPRFQRREWKVQRCVWLLMYATVVAVTMGVIGKGILSQATLRTSDGSLILSYERFLRYRAADGLRILIRSPEETVKVSFDSTYFKHIGVRNILPEPEETLMTHDTVTLTFRNTPSAPAMVLITISPERTGIQRGWVSVADGGRHPLTQFVYP